MSSAEIETVWKHHVCGGVSYQVAPLLNHFYHHAQHDDHFCLDIDILNTVLFPARLS